jgi:hypothetical protein
MIEGAVTPKLKMLYDMGTGFYCMYCDYYFHPELNRSGVPEKPIHWTAFHHKVECASAPPNCPFVGKTFEIDVAEVFPEAREVQAK